MYVDSIRTRSIAKTIFIGLGDISIIQEFGGEFFFRRNYNVNDYKTDAIFHKDVLQSWVDFRNDLSTKLPMSKTTIWTQRFIKVDSNYFKARIVLCNKLQFV